MTPTKLTKAQSETCRKAITDKFLNRTIEAMGDLHQELHDKLYSQSEKFRQSNIGKCRKAQLESLMAIVDSLEEVRYQLNRLCR